MTYFLELLRAEVVVYVIKSLCFWLANWYIHCSPLNNAMLGPIGTDCVVSHVIFGTISQRNYRKMTILWSFSYNSLVKFHGKKFLKPQHDHVISIYVIWALS